ncbi:hypothetical protein [Sulfobacillus thermosulfidooxidans]|uniref:hypothetical protein n=1 Tax=Sulfobacillus thermosulfidooxidans TaxID=28034 RepID=UPI0006B5E652|nr:hypothetical protein [Sulfobacillus thermosulfidooxidans]
MNTSSRFMGWMFGLGFVLTLIIAAIITHNSASKPLTFAQVITVSLIPLGLLGLATLYYGQDHKDASSSHSSDRVHRSSHVTPH